MAQIGVQLMTVRERINELGVFESLGRLAKIGLPITEVSQLAMTEENLAAMEAARSEWGTEFSSLSATLEPQKPGKNPSLVDHFSDVVSACHRLGATRLRLGMMPFSAMATPAGLAQFCEAAEQMAQRLAAEGIKFAYHNHHVEFARTQGKQILDVIADGAPSMAWEVDVHWVQRGGEDPVRTLKRLAPRVDMVHLKDFRIALPPEAAFEALARGDMDTWSRHWPHLVQYAEVGSGNLHWPEIIEAGIAAGARYFFIEQDETYGRDPFEALAASHAALVDMGFAEMFQP